MPARPSGVIELPTRWPPCASSATTARRDEREVDGLAAAHALPDRRRSAELELDRLGRRCARTAARLPRAGAHAVRGQCAQRCALRARLRRAMPSARKRRASAAAHAHARARASSRFSLRRRHGARAPHLDHRRLVLRAVVMHAAGLVEDVGAGLHGHGAVGIELGCPCRATTCPRAR